MTQTSATPQSIEFFRSTAGKTGYAMAAGVWYKTQTIRTGMQITRKYNPIKESRVPETVLAEYDMVVKIR